MLHTKKSFISNLSLFMLFLTTSVHAESNALPQQVDQLQTQIQQMQTQLRDANDRISALETHLNSANHNISASTNSVQIDAANTDNVYRMANGHGR